MEADGYLSPQDAAQRLGVSTKTVYRHLRTGQIPALQLGGRKKQWRIPPSVLELGVDSEPLCWRPVPAVVGKTSKDLESDKNRQGMPVDAGHAHFSLPSTHGEMTRKGKSEKIIGKYFEWRFGKRGDVYHADGRSNMPSPGRFSLKTGNREEAIRELARREIRIAIELGIADESEVTSGESTKLPLQEGVRLYFRHLELPQVAGGVSAGTVKRYRPIFDKLVPFLEKVRLEFWNQVKKSHLEDYAAWLDGESYAYATEYLEITVVKQAFNHWIETELLPIECKIHFPMAKPTETDTYCYRPEEVQAMIQLCQEDRNLAWLADIITALVYTGMRISELAGLLFSDIDFDSNMIILVDETKSKRARKGKARSIKHGHSRSFPIHPNLRLILDRLKALDASGRVFKAQRGGILRPDNMRHILIKKVIEPLSKTFPSSDEEIGFKDGRIHSFRHFFCSMCANRGVPEQVLMKWLGHKSSKMVKRYYHLFDEEAQRQMKRLDFFEGTDAS